MNPHRLVIAMLLPALLAGCFMKIGDEDEPISATLVAGSGPQPATDVVIVLPGAGADAQTMIDKQVAESVHKAWPEVDVLLTNATLAYYFHQVLVPRLEADVVAPALERYQRVWLAGASIGGMGALMYERWYPRRVAGLVLFAPWLGEREILEEIRAAGGVRGWDPGPVPEAIVRDNYQRELWRLIKGLGDKPAEAKRVWMVVGREDRLLEADRLMAPVLPQLHYFEVDGGHTWETWRGAAETIMAKLREINGVRHH